MWGTECWAALRWAATHILHIQNSRPLQLAMPCCPALPMPCLHAGNTEMQRHSYCSVVTAPQTPGVSALMLTSHHVKLRSVRECSHTNSTSCRCTLQQQIHRGEAQAAEHLPDQTRVHHSMWVSAANWDQNTTQHKHTATAAVHHHEREVKGSVLQCYIHTAANNTKIASSSSSFKCGQWMLRNQSMPPPLATGW